MIKEISSYYWQLCLLKKSPENTPYSPFLMILSALLLMLIMVVQWKFSAFLFADDILLLAFIALCLLFSFIIYTYGVLFFRGFANRFVQTITCLFFAYFIIHLIASPLFVLDTYLAQAQVKNPLLLLIGIVYLFVTVGLSIWQFVVTAHIYQYALSITPMQSILAALGLIAVNILTLSFGQ